MKIETESCQKAEVQKEGELLQQREKQKEEADLELDTGQSKRWPTSGNERHELIQ